MDASQVEPSSNRLLVQRLRASLWIILFGLLLLSLRDLWHDPMLILPAYLIRLGHGLLVVGLLRALRVERLAKHAVALALLTGIAQCIETTAVSILRHDILAGPLFLSGAAMFAATAFPWGLWAQLTAVVCGELTIMWNLYAVTGGLMPAVSYTGVATALMFAVSVYMAWELDRHRTLVEQKTLARRRSEAHFRSLIENASDLITVMRPDGTILYDSPAHERVLGYTQKERTGSNALALVHPDDLPHVLDVIAHGLQIPGQVTQLEYRYRHKNGSWRYVEALGRNLLDDPAVGAIVVNSRDVTERRHAEEALRGSEAYLKALFECAPDAYYLNDLDGRFVDGNRAAEELVGYKREELIGKNFLTLDLFPADQIPKLAALLAQSKDHPIGPEELILRRKDQRDVAIEIRTIPVQLNGQTLVLGIARDITERRQAAKALAFTNAVLATQQETSIDGILVVDEQAKIISCNQRFIDMWGIPPDLIASRADEPVLQWVVGHVIDPIAPGDSATLGSSVILHLAK